MMMIIAETMVFTHLLTFLCIFPFLLKDLNFFSYDYLICQPQNIFCCYFHSQNEYIGI